MKIRIGVWGSCVTRDIFRSVFNNYKEYFEITSSLMTVSLISLMGDCIDFDYEDIKIYPLDKANVSTSKALEYDLSKTYLKKIGENIDYLIIDEFFDVYFGVIKINGTYITNNHWNYPRTKFYEKIKYNNKLTLYDNYLEYYSLWKNNCDAFFEYLHEKFPNVKIILNKVQIGSKVLKKDGSYYIDENYQRDAEKYNSLFKLLENYLEKNHDVLVVDCAENVIVNENHIWGKGSVHFTDEFYMNAFKKILDVINEDQINNKISDNSDDTFSIDSDSNLEPKHRYI